jgi:hypothetical protein
MTLMSQDAHHWHTVYNDICHKMPTIDIQFIMIYVTRCPPLTESLQWHICHMAPTIGREMVRCTLTIKTPWPESATELYRLSNCPLSAKLVPRFQRDGSQLPYSRLSRPEPLFFFQVAPQLYSRGWVDPVQDPLLLRKSVGVENRTRTSGSVARNSDHWTTEAVTNCFVCICI